jgi:hypothetical protein
VVFALWADVPGHPLRWPSPGITSGDVLTAADAQVSARYLTSRVLAEVTRRAEHRKMLPDQGCYEERYRLTGSVAWELALPLLLLIPAVLGSQPIGWLILSLVAFAVVTLPSVLAVASRRTAFRADHAGITLGPDPLRGPTRHISPVLIPWADVDRIILYRGPATRGLAVQDGPCIGIQRRPGAPPLPWGNKPARRCPVPGVAAGAARPVTAWRLDRDRLAALTAAMAPGIPVVDASTDPAPGVEDPGQGGSVSELGPAD